MLQYIVTGLAGIALGVVLMRVWQYRGDAGGANEESRTAAPVADGSTLLSTRNLLIGAGAIAAVALAVFALRSTGEVAPQSSSAAAASAEQQLADVDTMIGKLAARLEANPDDGEGFRMLGWSYVMTGRPQEALAPYKRALELLPNNAVVHSGYGEALAGTANGTVTKEAKAAFERALSFDPKEPRARYFLALWQAQNGQEQPALDQWIALANSGPADAPWQTDVRQKITEVSGKLGMDVSGRLKNASPAAMALQAPALDPAAVEAANQMPASDRQSMIDGMVEGLAEKLKANPGDADGWVRLLRSRMVLKQAEQAGRDLAAARKGLAGDKAGLGKVDAAAREFGVPGA